MELWAGRFSPFVADIPVSSWISLPEFPAAVAKEGVWYSMECTSPCFGTVAEGEVDTDLTQLLYQVLAPFVIFYLLQGGFSTFLPGLSHPSSCFSLNPQPFLAAGSLFPFPALGWRSSCGFMGAKNTNKPQLELPWSSLGCRGRS